MPSLKSYWHKRVKNEEKDLQGHRTQILLDGKTLYQQYPWEDNLHSIFWMLDAVSTAYVSLILGRVSTSLSYISG